MILTETIKKFYSSTLEKIKNAKFNKEKQEIIIELIENLMKADIKFSVKALAKALNVSRKLINKALIIIAYPFILIILSLRVETRGRKKVEDKHPEIIGQIKEICENSEYVDKSLKDRIVYIDLTLSGIKEKLKENYNYSDKECPCENTIRRILTKKLGYKITKVKKNRVFKKIEETDEIFDNVNAKLKEIENSDGSIIGISIDDKVSKYVGYLSAGGKSWVERNALDHDTNPDYIVKPFGIMDLKTKVVRVYCTTSNSTADYKVDCIEEYLKLKLEENPNISELYIFSDNGSENSSRRKLWKYRIIELAKKYGIKIELVYYPPYHSKYNKIEHYWGVLQRHWSGLIIDDLDKLIGAINSCTWDKINSIGILSTKVYEKGRKIDECHLKEMEEKHISFPNENIKKWSLIITP